MKLATKGVSTSREFAHLMSALMSDVIDGSITPDISNAAVNAGGKLLKVVELQFKYGTPAENGNKILNLCGSEPKRTLALTARD